MFLSYSRKDQDLVGRIRKLLSLSGRRVFWDVVSIVPGQVWAQEIETALQNSDLVVLLWCCDTARSKWVKREIRLARRSAKTKVPVLLCSFPPPLSVRRLQWIDLSEFVKHTCSSHPVEEERTALFLPDRFNKTAAGLETTAPTITALLTGWALIILALTKPFHSPFTPSVTSLLNAAALALGYLLCGFGYINSLLYTVNRWRMRRRRARLVVGFKLEPPVKPAFLSKFPRHSAEWYSSVGLTTTSIDSLSAILQALSSETRSR